MRYFLPPPLPFFFSCYFSFTRARTLYAAHHLLLPLIHLILLAHHHLIPLLLGLTLILYIHFILPLFHFHSFFSFSNSTLPLLYLCPSFPSHLLSALHSLLYNCFLCLPIIFVSFIIPLLLSIFLAFSYSSSSSFSSSFSLFWSSSSTFSSFSYFSPFPHSLPPPLVPPVPFPLTPTVSPLPQAKLTVRNLKHGTYFRF